MKKSNLIWIFSVTAIFILLVLNLVFFIKISETTESLAGLNSAPADVNFTKKIALESKCPDSAGGNNQSYLHIKYFYSEYCSWCKREEPILQKIVGEYGNLIYIEWFNIQSCPEDVNTYKVSGVPTTIFRASDENKEYSHYGFIYEKDLRTLICDVTGGC